MGGIVQIDWWFTPCLILMIAVSSCSIADNVTEIKNHIIEKEDKKCIN